MPLGAERPRYKMRETVAKGEVVAHRGHVGLGVDAGYVVCVLLRLAYQFGATVIFHFSCHLWSLKELMWVCNVLGGAVEQRTAGRFKWFLEP